MGTVDNYYADQREHEKTLSNNHSIFLLYFLMRRTDDLVITERKLIDYVTSENVLSIFSERYDILNILLYNVCELK